MVIRTQNTFECDNPNCKKRVIETKIGKFNPGTDDFFEEIMPLNWIDAGERIFCSNQCYLDKK